MSVPSLSQLLEDVKENITTDTIATSDILDLFHERCIGLILIIFAAPMALPVPVPPGINIMLASPLVLLTGHQAIGAKRIWIPKKFKTKLISAEKLRNTITPVIPWLKKIEYLLRP